MSLIRTPFDRSLFGSAMKLWKARKPAFMWVPGSDNQNLLLDQAKGAIGKRVGTKPLSYGGLVNPVGGSSTDWVEFPTNAGISAANQHFWGLMIVSVIDPTAVRGAFLKIGTSGGVGFGAGNTTFDESGSKIIVLAENVAWVNSGPTGAFRAGGNVLAFAEFSGNIVDFTNLTKGTNTGGGRSYLAAEAKIFIDGYTADRGSNVKVHAVAIYNESLSGADYDAARTRLYRAVSFLNGMPRSGIDQLLSPTSHKIWVGPSSAILPPTLLAASAVNIGDTYATPRVAFTRP